MPLHGIDAASTSLGGRASSVSSNKGAENCRPPSRTGSVLPVSTGLPPPVSTSAANVRRRPGTRTCTAARRTGRSSVACDSPKSVYGNSQASAKTEHDGLTRKGGPHDLDVQIALVDLGDQRIQLGDRSEDRAVLADADPQTGPLAEIQRADHPTTLPADTRVALHHKRGRRAATPSAAPRAPQLGRSLLLGRRAAAELPVSSMSLQPLGDCPEPCPAEWFTRTLRPTLLLRDSVGLDEVREEIANLRTGLDNNRRGAGRLRAGPLQWIETAERIISEAR